VVNSQNLTEVRVYITLAFAFLVFIGISSVIIITAQIALYSNTSPMPLEPQLKRKDLPVSLRLGILSPLYLFPATSITLALVVKMKCLNPLERNLIPEEKILITITILGYILGAILAGILLTIAYRKIYG